LKVLPAIFGPECGQGVKFLFFPHHDLADAHAANPRKFAIELLRPKTAWDKNEGVYNQRNACYGITGLVFPISKPMTPHAISFAGLSLIYDVHAKDKLEHDYLHMRDRDGSRIV